jgi:hypothetical protein
MPGFAGQNLATPVEGRTCGECSLCCKLPHIDEMGKPAGVWCKHCAPGKGGCKIYPTRPLTCQRFMCLWLITEDLDDRWKPTTSKIVPFIENEGHRIAIHVDPGFPNKWREEPYYGQIKSWSEFAVDNDAQVVVYVKNRAIVVLPNKETDLGNVRPEDHIYVGERSDLPFRDWDAWVVPYESIPPEKRDKWNSGK